MTTKKIIKEQVIGIENVDNTSDMDKPVSTAQQQAISNITNDIVHKSGTETITGSKTFTEVTQLSRAIARADSKVYVFYGNPLPSIWEDAKIPIAKPNQFNYFAWDKISIQASLTNGEDEDWQNGLITNYTETNRKRLVGGDTNSGMTFRLTDADNNPYIQRLKVEIEVDPTSGTSGRMWLNDFVMMGSFARTSWNMKIQAMRVGSTTWTNIATEQYNRKQAEFITHVSHPTLYFGNNSSDYNRIRIIFYDFEGLSTRMPNSTGVFWKLLWFGVYPNKLNKPTFSTDELGNTTFNGTPKSTATYMPSANVDLVNKAYVDNLIMSMESSAFSFKGFISSTSPMVDLREGLLWYNTTDFPNVNFPWSTAIYQNGSWQPNSTGYTPNAGDLWANLNDQSSGWYYMGDSWHLLDFSGSTFNDTQFDTSTGIVSLRDGIIDNDKIADNARISSSKLADGPFLRTQTTEGQGDVDIVATTFGISIENNGRLCVNGNDVAYSSDIVSYSLDEQFTGRYWLDGKKIYQKTISCGTLPNATTKNVSHNIANIDMIVEPSSGTCTDGTSFLPIPFSSSTSGGNIMVYPNKTNIVIGTTSNRTVITTTYVTIFYTCTDR